ncbi:MAG: hypothetical protein RLY31_1211 [Bacteroidota bacterium]
MRETESLRSPYVCRRHSKRISMIHFFRSLLLVSLSAFASCGNKNGGDDMPVLPDISLSGVSKFEGDSSPGTFEFKAVLAKPGISTVQVDYTTRDGSAIAGEDYLPAAGTLVFEPGVLERVIQVDVLADTLKEGDEEFDVLLSNPQGAQLLTASARGTIRNDDTFLPGGDEGYITPGSYAGYSMVWQDEFDGDAIDPANWTYDIGNSGWGNNEWQYYTDRPENAFLSDGKLVIEARKENFGGANYTSARMKTEGLQEFQYGRIDIRAKLPLGQGIWPALWMLGHNIGTIGWPKCGEIDIMEIIGSEPAKLHGTVHWDDNGHASFGNSVSLPSGTFADQYHVFSIIWDDKQIRWLLDDVPYNAVDITPASLSEFHHPYFLLFNIAVGGNWPGYPDASTVFPQRMWVDYVRVFQQQ